ERERGEEAEVGPSEHRRGSAKQTNGGKGEHHSEHGSHIRHILAGITPQPGYGQGKEQRIVRMKRVLDVLLPLRAITAGITRMTVPDGEPVDAAVRHVPGPFNRQ